MSLSDKAAPLTREAIISAMETVMKDTSYRSCGITEPHVVHPKATGWTNCANCFALVYLPEKN